MAKRDADLLTEIDNDDDILGLPEEDDAKPQMKLSTIQTYDDFIDFSDIKQSVKEEIEESKKKKMKKKKKKLKKKMKKHKQVLEQQLTELEGKKERKKRKYIEPFLQV